MEAVEAKFVRGALRWGVYLGLVEDLRRMAAALPLAVALRAAAMRDRHWRALSGACNRRGKPPPFPRTPLGDLLAFQLHDHVASARAIADAANTEHKVELALGEVSLYWGGAAFEFALHRPGADLPLPHDQAALLECLDDHQIRLRALHGIMGKDLKAKASSGAEISANGNGGPGEGESQARTGGAAQVEDEDEGEGASSDFFRSEVVEWQEKLATVEGAVSALLKASTRWQTIEAVFRAPDIAEHVSKEVYPISKAFRTHISHTSHFRPLKFALKLRQPKPFQASHLILT